MVGRPRGTSTPWQEWPEHIDNAQQGGASSGNGLQASNMPVGYQELHQAMAADLRSVSFVSWLASSLSIAPKCFEVSAMRDGRALAEQCYRIIGEMALLGDLCPGLLAKRYHCCGKPSCHCQLEGDLGHGLHYILKYHKSGRQTTRSIPVAEVKAMTEQVATFQRLRRLCGEYLAGSPKLSDARRAECAGDAAQQAPG